MNSTFPAKLILFGEYAIVLGSEALAIPFNHYSGQFILPTTAEETEKESNKTLQGFHKYLEEAGFAKTLNLKQFREDIRNGLYFKSDIPVGYGLGSSGAICAAFYTQYKNVGSEESLVALKKTFATIESHFHGRSSGTDPMVIYLNHPVLLSSENIQQLDLNWQRINNNLTIFLVNTKKTASTGILVEEFLQDLKSEAYSRRIHQEYLPLTKKVIDSFIAQEEDFYGLIERLSTFQLEYFRKMIPDNYFELWRHGLLTRKFALKLCGSGGGGFLLGFSKEPSADIALLFDRTFQEEVMFMPITS